MASFKPLALCAVLAAAPSLQAPAFAHANHASEASLALSALPVAVSVVAPSMVLSAGAAFTVVFGFLAVIGER